MKRDLKVNYSEMREILAKLQSTSDTLHTLRTSSETFWKVLQEQDSASFEKVANFWATIFYRGGNAENALGQWFTMEPPESVIKVRIDTAVKPQWIDPITGELTGESIVDTVYAIKIPKGTTVYSKKPLK